MAIKDFTDAQRLSALHDHLAEIAAGIRAAQMALIGSAEIADTAYLVSSTLGRLGWMADQGCVMAGADVPPVVGDATAWMLEAGQDKGWWAVSADDPIKRSIGA